MTWINLENTSNDSVQELLDWAEIKAESDCSLPEECCGGGI